MKCLLPILFIGFSPVMAQKPFFPAYDYFKESSSTESFPYQAANAYLFPNQQARDTATLGQWLNTLEPIQRHFFFCAVTFQVYDNIDCEQLIPYLPKYEAEFLEGLRALSYPQKDIACFSKVLSHLSSLKRSGSKFRPYFGCDIRFQNDTTKALLTRFARDSFARLFSTDLGSGFDDKYSGSLTKQEYRQQNTLRIKNGIPVSEEIRDSAGILDMRNIFNCAGKDSCRQWFYKNGLLKRQSIERQGERTETEYYDTGSLFQMHYVHNRKIRNEGLDSMTTMIYHENGRKLYEYISSSIGLPKDLGSFWTEKAWDDSGNITYEKGNGVVSSYELLDGKLHIQKRELKLDSSLFLSFTPLLHWEDTTRAFVDAVTKDYIRAHPWAGYPSSAETCLTSLTASTNSQLDSFQQAVLHPVFEVVCSIYQPWNEADSLVLTNLLKEPAIQKDPRESLKKELITSWYHGFAFGTETLHRIYLMQNDDTLKKQSWYYPNKSDTKNHARSKWDFMVFELQFLKQSASPEEMVVWLARNVKDLTYLYKDIWEYDTIYPRQTLILRATQDSVEHYWLPKLKKLQKKVWQKLTAEERTQIIALRKVYHEFVRDYRAESRLMRYRLHRNQTPSRNEYIETMYDFMDTAYPNFRYMQLVVQRPASLAREELDALSNNIYAGLGKQKDELQNIEKQIFATLKPCSSIWSSPFAWYWKGKDEERLRALNFMLID